MTIHPVTQPTYATPSSSRSASPLLTATPRTADTTTAPASDLSQRRTTPVFVDDSGRRALVVRLTSALLVLAAAALSAMLLVSLVQPSAVPLP